MKIDLKISVNQNLLKTKNKNSRDSSTFKNSKDQLEPILFLPKNKSRKGEGGVRTKGYNKNTNIKKPLITVITVVINNQTQIEETILSVVNQSYINIEYLIIDGGSSDNTLNIIKKYDNIIDYWVSEKDEGIYDAMNKGCRLASGDGLCFLNSGDKFMGNVFNNEFKLPFLIPCKIKESKSFVWEKKVSNKKFGMPTSHQAMVFLNKRLLFNLKYKVSSDYDFFIRHGTFSNTELNCSGYVLYDNQGMSRKNLLRRDFESLIIIYNHYGIISSFFFIKERILVILNKLFNK